MANPSISIAKMAQTMAQCHSNGKNAKRCLTGNQFGEQANLSVPALAFSNTLTTAERIPKPGEIQFLALKRTSLDLDLTVS